MDFSLISSMRLHRSVYFEDMGSIPVAATVSGVSRVVLAIGFIAINAILLPIDATIALGEMVFTDATTFRNRVLDDITAIFYNMLQILHGAIDMIPLIGNAPYWIRSSLGEGQPVSSPWLIESISVNSIHSGAFHKSEFFEKGGCIPVLSTITGGCRIIASIGATAINAIILPVDATMALGEIVFTNEKMFQVRTIDDVRTIFYNAMQIIHGVIDVVPIIGNIPYWIKAACKDSSSELPPVL